MKQSCQPVQCMCAPRTQARGLARSPRTQGIKLSPSPVSRAVPPADRVLERRRRRKLTHPRARTSAETTTPEGREPRPLADAPSGHLPVVPVPPPPLPVDPALAHLHGPTPRQRTGSPCSCRFPAGRVREYNSGRIVFLSPTSLSPPAPPRAS
jgi:hypothetical protein